MPLNPALTWFLVGLGLILLEFTMPGALLVFFGLGAWIAALTTWVGLTDSLAWQVLVFAVSSALLLAVLRRRLRGMLLGHTTGVQNLDHDLEEFVGHTVLVLEEIGPGAEGRIELKGAGWTAHSQSRLVPGDRAVITSRDGIHVTVRPLDPTPRSSEEDAS